MLKIQNDTIVKLLRKVIRKEAITKEEQKTLDDWRTDSAHHQNIFDDVMKEARWENDLKLLLARDEKAIWNNILSKTRESHVTAKVVESKTSRYNYAAAAVLLGAVLIGSIFYLRSGSHKEIAETTVSAEKKSVGRDEERAYLALSDGSTIYLNAAKNGELAREGNSRINKLKDGELVYDAANPALPDQLPLTFNILSTPRATQYKITLPDGSRVWLNAASSLRFPSSFNGEERVVELKGEAYFEIAPSSGRPGRQNRIPFSVKANGMSVDVLGTHFNVMAYREESEMKTSLLQGSVRVSNGANVCLLKPGQQAQVVNDLSLPVRPRRTIQVVTGRNDEAIAWKNGFLRFKKADISTVLRQISRSYKVNIVYKSQPHGSFSGIISLKTPIQEVIEVLKLSGVNVVLDGNNLVIHEPTGA